MKEFIDNLMSGIGVTDILDIAIVAFAVYKILGFIKQSRAEQLVKGLLLLIVIMILSGFFHFYAVNWVLKSTLTVGVIALVVVFQPELRRGLEHMGRSKLLNGTIGQVDKDKAKNIVSQFVKAIEEASASKTGVLLVFERQSSLMDICETGTVIDSEITSELLGNIFYEGAPLHDGAVIVRGDRLYSAGCVLPLTENKSLPTELGTRHRAGIGITEKSDALTIIVSEETGIISMAKDGKLDRYLESKNVEKTLLDMYLKKESKEIFAGVKKVFTGSEGDKKDV
ncbi:MAG: diadenylate cyclase CdaA [Eubacteriaceae bacterium]|nr:diadenylate cyclase CdaA [Eubacteriaceae bacterium]